MVKHFKTEEGLVASQAEVPTKSVVPLDTLQHLNLQANAPLRAGLRVRPSSVSAAKANATLEPQADDPSELQILNENTWFLHPRQHQPANALHHSQDNSAAPPGSMPGSIPLKKAISQKETMKRRRQEEREHQEAKIDPDAHWKEHLPGVLNILTKCRGQQR